MNAEEIWGIHPQVKRPMSLGLRMLGPQYRQEVIHTMKGPLRVAIEEVGCGKKGILNSLRTLRAVWQIFRICRRFPVPTRENSRNHNTIVLLELRDWFFDHLNMRVPMFWSVWNMFINLYEHAGEYTDVFNVLIEEVVKIHNNGQWFKSGRGKPIKRFWRNQ